MNFQETRIDKREVMVGGVEEESRMKDGIKGIRHPFLFVGGAIKQLDLLIDKTSNISPGRNVLHYFQSAFLI